MAAPSKRAALWLVRVIFFAVGVALYLLAVSCRPRDATDSPEERSGLVLYIDHGTGCQYVKGGLLGGTTPRLDNSGRPMCGSTP